MSTRRLTAAAAAAALCVAGGALAAQEANRTAPAGPAAAATAEHGAQMNWYGGPAYLGKPALEATAALLKAGGGAQHFSFEKALVSMLGEKTVKAEVAKLTKQYGAKNVHDWIAGSDVAVGLAVKYLQAEEIELPAAPANLHGAELAKALVKAGTAPDGTFWAGRFYDVAFSHKGHNEVMTQINAKQGGDYDATIHRITNQAMYDVAQALGMKEVKLASFH